jgi:hypothetical protein
MPVYDLDFYLIYGTHAFKSITIITSMYISKFAASTVDNFKDIPAVGASHKHPTRHGGALRTPSNIFGSF